MRDWDDVPEELAQHVEDRYRELRAAGRSEADARAEAMSELDDQGGELSGGLADVRPRRSLVADLWPDARYTLRGLRRNPLFGAVIIATLGLGIGATAAIFSVVNAVLLRPLPYDAGNRLVVAWGDLRRPGLNDIPASAGEFVDFRDRNRQFDAMAAYETDGFNLTGGGNPERVEGALVTPSLFPLLGVSALHGRTFRPDEERPGQENVVLLSHSLWTRRFNADATMVGRTIGIDGKPMLVAGVMPPAFHFPDRTTEIWKPILLDADALSANNRGSHGYTMLGAMKPGVTIEQAQADLNAIAATFQQAYPGNYRNGFGVSLRLWRDEIVGETDRPLLMMLAAVAMVLLIACANVANLLLARATARSKEIALRAALGATRARLVRQLLTESVIVAVLGGIAGLAFASWAVRALVAIAPEGIPRIREVTLDGRVVVFTTFVTLTTAIIFGIVPAVKTSALRGRLSAGRAASNLLVVAEVALSFVLLASAGLLIHSFVRLQTVEPGFASTNLLTFRLSLPPARYTSFAQGDRFFDSLFAALQANPAITATTAINAMPFSGNGGSRSFNFEGRPVRTPAEQPEEQLRIVSAGYFAAMKIPLLKGREFTAGDTLDHPRAAVVNDAFARKHFPAGGAIGARLAFTQSDPKWYEIVGIVGNIKHRGLDAADRPELYVPYKQPLFESWTVRPMYIALRTATDPLTVAAAVRREIARLDPDQPIADVRTMDDRIQESLAGRRFSVLLLALFATLAVMLAAVGLYGVIAYSVSQRTKEIGVRIALGAQRRDVLRMVVTQGMALAAAGTIVGAAAAAALTRTLASLLFGVTALDPTTFAIVPVTLLAVAAAACYLPARTATRVEALTALRHE